MKLVRFDGGRIGVVRDDRVIDVTAAAGCDPNAWPPTGMVQLIHAWLERREALAFADGPGVPLETVRLDPPVVWPNKLIGFPVNYVAHGEEMSSGYTARTRGFFMKSPSSITGPADQIVLPDIPGREVHHEAELAVIIGAQASQVSAADAMNHVFGYSCLLDMTVRGLEVERTMRKSYDTFTPLGPWIVTADEIDDPGALELELRVGERIAQQANTRDLVIDIPAMVEMASSVMVLYPGDVIATGTPAGVGPVVAGDVLTITIEQVGSMRIPVVQGSGGNNSAIRVEVPQP